MVSFPSQIHLFGIRGNFKHIFHHNLHTYNRTVLILCYFPLPTITESPNFASDERTPAPLDSHAPKSDIVAGIYISVQYECDIERPPILLFKCVYANIIEIIVAGQKKKGDTMDEITPIAIPASLAF